MRGMGFRQGFGAAAAAMLLLLPCAHADPTWPAETDELEEIMYQMKEFKMRNFYDTITPCTNEASGPGRQNAAEWLRAGFHDMATANVHTGRGGLDGSLVYRLDDGESLGPGFNTTLHFMANYVTKRSSLSDLIALGVVASVRSCGGPKIPFRGGRVDADGPGEMGVPQPEHSIEQFQEQFARMGFSPQEMIQLTACGHTIGGVHDTEFPELVEGGEAPSDTTVARFDEMVITEYLDGTTQNPLVVGPAIEAGKDSDARIFASDGNKTVKAMSDNMSFGKTCQAVLQKMIEVVPDGVTLSDPIEPYFIKPVGMQLTLERASHYLRLTGHIRVRITDVPLDSIKGMELRYKDQEGGDDCGSKPCVMAASVLGAGYGLEDSFAFFPINHVIDASRGISSFTVTLNYADGRNITYDNNHHGYPMQDAVMIQTPQTCLMQHTGETNVTAAIRNDRAHLPATLAITYKMPRPGLPVPGLHEMTMSMRKGECVGPYTLYHASWTIPGGVSFSSHMDIISGEGDDLMVDDFNYAAELPGRCAPFYAPPASSCTTMPVSPTITQAAVSAYPTTILVTATKPWSSTTSASAAPSTTQTGSGAVYDARPLESDHGISKSTFLHGVANFGEYLISCVANFFGFDRYQMVNHRFGTVA